MYSPELEKFLKAYQINEDEIIQSDKKCIYFKNRGGILACVELFIKK